jgi:hypothetical protein
LIHSRPKKRSVIERSSCIFQIDSWSWTSSNTSWDWVWSNVLQHRS